ncbi:hypothetical protein XI05_07490 [Bradyrhizobium sp. CCBAU 11357]|nr:hypothetical protein [Bradyrhizobium sp. CCBAU 11357]
MLLAGCGHQDFLLRDLGDLGAALAGIADTSVLTLRRSAIRSPFGRAFGRISLPARFSLIQSKWPLGPTRSLAAGGDKCGARQSDGQAREDAPCKWRLVLVEDIAVFTCDREQVCNVLQGNTNCLRDATGLMRPLVQVLLGKEKTARQSRKFTPTHHS